MEHNDTICAVATASGGAIGIIRVSGTEAIRITDKIFRPVDKHSTPLDKRDANTINFGFIRNGKDEIIDEVLVSIFRAPHSYTGEDSVEISCHGSSYVLQQVMRLLIENGCRSAGPGEYTQRAFLNGKMDLSQAEAVADLIKSTSAATHRMAMNQMRGGFSRELSTLRDKLLKLTSLMELELDFSDHEELEFADRDELKQIALQVKSKISGLATSFNLGNAIKNGIPVAIIGETNAGKSTLLNTLVGEDRAIVSDIHGTTRDVIEDTVNINGTVFRFIDTAGIRDTKDTIERLGIDLTFKKINQADIIIWMVDATDKSDRIKEISEKLYPLCNDKQLIVAYNKTDITNQPVCTEIEKLPPHAHQIHISAKFGTNIDKLKQMLLTFANVPEISQSDIIITNTRHYEALIRSLEAVNRVIDGINENIPSDLVAQDLRECISHLAEITGGEITSEETLQNIFKHFCIGK